LKNVKGWDEKVQIIYFSILAYWEIFLDRFCDKLYMSITYNLLLKLHKDIGIILDMNVISDEADKVIQLMNENPDIARKRKQLDTTIKKCREALNIIDSF